MDPQTQFERRHPLVYARLVASPARRSNAAVYAGAAAAAAASIWPALLARVTASTTNTAQKCVARNIGSGAQVAINKSDEFGVDDLIVLLPNSKAISVATKSNTSYTIVMEKDAFDPDRGEMIGVGIWKVPFQDGAMILFQNVTTKHHELVWFSTQRGHRYDLSNWALNHNTPEEDPDEFKAPPFLIGDPTLSAVIHIAATEGRADIVGARVATVAVNMRQRDLLMFDQALQNGASGSSKQKSWRQLLTTELYESQAPVTAMCYVLDELLLFASADGILRAHPRGNAKSTYHVGDVKALVYHLTGLYNVVAIVYGAAVLEVRLVERKTQDPFVDMSRVLFRATNVDTGHAPLLYGPYVLYKTHHGWQQVMYDTPLGASQVKIVSPYVGWTLVGIKMANWSYLVVVLQQDKTRVLEDVILTPRV